METAPPTIAPPRKRRSIPKSFRETLYHPCGHLAIPLRDVLAILKLRQRNTLENIRLFSTETRKIVFKVDRPTSPWEPLRDAGLLAPETFLPLAQAFYDADSDAEMPTERNSPT